MAWLARDKDNELYLYENKPIRDKKRWSIWGKLGYIVNLPLYFDENYFHRKLTWEDEAVEIEIKDK